MNTALISAPAAPSRVQQGNFPVPNKQLHICRWFIFTALFFSCLHSFLFLSLTELQVFSFHLNDAAKARAALTTIILTPFSDMQDICRATVLSNQCAVFTVLNIMSVWSSGGGVTACCVCVSVLCQLQTAPSANTDSSPSNSWSWCSWKSAKII